MGLSYAAIRVPDMTDDVKPHGWRSLKAWLISGAALGLVFAGTYLFTGELTTAMIAAVVVAALSLAGFFFT